MRFDHLTIHELGPFAHVELDLTQAAGPLVAVTGPNGAGKSTLLELLVGALYRRTPTRGSLVDLATSRDGFLEARVMNGRPWTIRQTVDKVSGKSESVVLDEAGHPALADAKVRSFDAWAAATLPARDILEASLFQAQNSHGFMEMSAAERKSLLLRILGIERLEQLADRARDRRREALSARDRVEAVLREVREVAVPEVERALADAIVRVAELDGDCAAARAELDRLRDLAARAGAARAEREQVRIEAEAGRARVEALRKRLENNRRVLEEEGAIRDALGRLAEATSEASAAEAGALECRRAGEDSAREGQRARAAVYNLERQVADGERAMADARARWARHRDALAHAEGLVLLESGIRDVEARAEGAERTLAELQSAQAGRSATRIGEMRGTLGYIAEGGEDLRLAASEALEADDRHAARETSYPADLLAAQFVLRGARAELARARTARDEVARAAASIDPGAEAAVREAGARLDTARSELGQARADLEERLRAHEVVAEASRVAAERRLAAQQQLADAQRSVSRWPAGVEQILGAARTRIDELEPQAEEALRQADALAARLAQLEAAPSVDLTGQQVLVDRLEREAREAHALVATLERELVAARASAERRAELVAMRQVAESDLADWTRLAQDLGRDGLQAYEIDAAVPELVTLVNDLLHTCVSPRWTISIETTRLDAEGKRAIEGLEVRVLDTERGREARAETFSGGERVLLGEAVSLALTMLACRRSGQVGPTIVRDESGAALDAERARAYVAMLRRAAGIVGASRVLIVTHSDDVASMCDSTIRVAGGSVCLA